MYKKYKNIFLPVACEGVAGFGAKLRGASPVISITGKLCFGMLNFGKNQM